MKHKHSKLIKAWADGAEIQVKHARLETWHDLDTPLWKDDRQYRIKPKTLKLNIELSEDQAEALFDLLNTSSEVTKNLRFVQKPFDSYKVFWREESLNNTRKSLIIPLNNFVADIRNEPLTKIS